MPLDPSVIGREAAPVRHTVEARHVLAFAAAIGDASPVYRSLEAARAAGHPGIPAPPTLFTAFQGGDVREGLDMDWARILHGSEEVTHHRPLHVGDEILVTNRIAEVFEKTGRDGGVMDFLVIETAARSPEGEPVYTVRRTVVVKRVAD